MYNITLADTLDNKHNGTMGNYGDGDWDVMEILHNIIACVGILSNATVAMALLSDKKLRGKIPNMFIINQVIQFINATFVN